MFFNHEKPRSALVSTLQWENVGQTKGKSHTGVSAASVCQRFGLASAGAGLQTVCAFVSLTRSYLAAGPGLVKEACSHQHARVPRQNKRTLLGKHARVRLSNVENALSLSQTLSSLKNLCLLRDPSPVRHPQRKDLIL